MLREIEHQHFNLFSIRCSSTCLTCSKTPDNCTACNSASTLPHLSANAATQTSTCIASCGSGKYSVISTITIPDRTTRVSSAVQFSECLTCAPNCVQCSASANRQPVCAACAAGYYLRNASRSQGFDALLGDGYEMRCVKNCDLICKEDYPGRVSISYR